MTTVYLLCALLAVGLTCGYLRVSLMNWTIATAATIALFVFTGSVGWLTAILVIAVFGAVAYVLNTTAQRRQLITRPVLDMYTRLAPKLSETEQVALEAGTVGWEGELFAGKPDFRMLHRQPEPELSARERSFMDGQVDTLCSMLDDWKISHELADLPPEVWEYLKTERFFGMIIPTEYGGLGFSAHAHSCVLQKVSSCSVTAFSTIAVPNSLGPAELLLHYGTEDQKNHYLPRLAKGEEIPCFGLTGPTAGSDATSIPDTGVVCMGTHQGKEVLGLRLNFDKRYITLAPVATVIGLAFQMKDPDGLLGEKPDVGISLALIPHDTEGVEIGRRHFPMNNPFQNGPIRGKDVFIPMSWLIGGSDMAGQGWRMLVEVLSVGRAISLPSSAAGGMRAVAMYTGAYARIRKQFNLSIGRFEGVQEALARIGGYTYAGTALARMTAAAVDRGEKPSVPSAIAKYHATELARKCVIDSMDILGGKGVILGPKNLSGRGYQGSPVAITVEGANIMTRSLMIFGQGAIRCHPYVLKEMAALSIEDRSERLKAFDSALFGHIGVAVSNACRSLILGVTRGTIARVPGSKATRRYYRAINRYSAALGLASDVSMLTLGGKLKFKERLSARLGDVLSQLYILSSILKRFEDDGRPSSDLPLLHWACQDATYKMQEALDGVMRNFPVRPVAWLMRAMIFPIGRWRRAPADRLGTQVANLLLSPNEARDRLISLTFKGNLPNYHAGQIEAALPDIIRAEPIERKLRKAVIAGQIPAADQVDHLDQAVSQNLINEDDRALIEKTRRDVAEIIAVDDFTTEELAAGDLSTSVPKKRRSKAREAA